MMKRLTKPGAEGAKAFCDGCVDGPRHICADKDTCDIPKIYTALQAYEDAGLTPEEIKILYRDAGLSLAIRIRDLEAENKDLRAKFTEWEASCDTRDKMLVDYAAELTDTQAALAEAVGVLGDIRHSAGGVMMSLRGEWVSVGSIADKVLQSPAAKAALEGVKGDG